MAVVSYGGWLVVTVGVVVGWCVRRRPMCRTCTALRRARHKVRPCVAAALNIP